MYIFVVLFIFINMEVTEILKKLEELDYFNNKKVGFTIANKYPLLYSSIIEKTKVLNNTKKTNEYFRARAIFLKKYNNDINNIKNSVDFLTFDRKKDDFIDNSGDYVKKGWDKIKSSLPKNHYSKKLTVEKLKNNNLYTKYIGRAKNRTLMNDDPILYNSIYHFTKFMDEFITSNKNLYSRIIFLIKYDNENDIKCSSCKKEFTSFNYSINDFNKVCKNCYFKNKKHYPNIEYFKEKYKENWEHFYKLDREKISKRKVNSKEWFVQKYGTEKGLFNYANYVSKRLDVLNNIKKIRYSKISQKLFWLIYNRLTEEEKKECFFKELNNEKLLKVDENKYYFPDFVYKDKIIEYDGIYWHNIEKDVERNNYYTMLGYKFIIINEKIFNRNKIDDNVINMCIEFLKNEI